MPQLYTYLLSDALPARMARRSYRAISQLTLPAPRIVVRPLLWIFLLVRVTYYFLVRILVCEPLFKAYCRQYGRGVRTGVFIHWVQGKGAIILGDDVLVDGKCNFSFASRFSNDPTLVVGDHSDIGHNCTFTVAKRIEIGSHCMIATDVHMFDSPGHPSSPEARKSGSPPAVEDVRPIKINDNVWIGSRSIIYPGVTIGENSIVATGSVVMTDVPANTLVAGNPARQVRGLA